MAVAEEGVDDYAGCYYGTEGCLNNSELEHKLISQINRADLVITEFCNA